ncbi:hypothetical protein COV23_01655 [Candidatus Wolfebacteria bacterium CG10_big_fil_rev_8_21_14_0_10_31_9]|uniref:Uncharacterized protein n=1 Tax=Candidatus Wolfebacteria bacterium CG10_big_fil_rev_8_21_14_0_10_31_9 TaxID=1975070 RepID=A0A2H0RCK6_9BACT|nr:MAG: hypothetical protein COV23_01655 [Candidatus Wolfebacteria bacterium CG10_big_fil_rev_8_21_14_0_10_31_9]
MKRIALLLMFLLFASSFVVAVMAEDQPKIVNVELKQFSERILILTFSFKDVTGGIGKANTEMALMANEDDSVIYQDTHEGTLDVRFSSGIDDKDDTGLFIGIFPMPVPLLSKRVSVVEVGIMITDDHGRKSEKVFSNKVVVINKGYKM